MAKPDSALLTRKRETPLRWEILLVIVLVLSLVLGRVLSPMFLTGANITNVLADLTEIALMALPMTLIIVAAEIDLSVASVLGASSALMGVLWHMGLPMPLVIVLVLIVGALAGLLNGLVIVRLNLPSLAVTIGTLALFRGLAYVLLGDQAVADFPAGGVRYQQSRFDLYSAAVCVCDRRRRGVHGAAAGHRFWPQSLCDRREPDCCDVLRH
jgi:rhamnose transport system permease protein